MNTPREVFFWNMRLLRDIIGIIIFIPLLIVAFIYGMIEWIMDLWRSNGD